MKTWSLLIAALVLAVGVASAQNPTSSAKGIGQLLDATYRNLGMKHTEASVPQLVATLAYIHRRHVTACNAWQFFKEKNYY